nr:unnamed protein product [Digitaria exilis]
MDPSVSQRAASLPRLAPARRILIPIHKARCAAFTGLCVPCRPPMLPELSGATTSTREEGPQHAAAPSQICSRPHMPTPAEQANAMV